MVNRGGAILVLSAKLGAQSFATASSGVKPSGRHRRAHRGHHRPLTDGHPVRERLPTLTGTTEPSMAVSIHVADCGLPAAGTGIALSACWFNN
jgi:hypothetical protein